MEKVFVVVHTSYHDGEFSSSGVDAVFADVKAAEKFAEERRDARGHYMDFHVQEVEIRK